MPKLDEDYVTSYLENGYVIIEDYLTHAECDELLADMWQVVEEFNEEDFEKGQGIYKPQHEDETVDDYLMKSAETPTFFLEKGSVEPGTNKLRVEKQYAVNKVGHSVHNAREVPRKYTFEERNRAVCKALGFRKPAVCQSMYRYKQKEIGDIVDTHTDSVYLMNGEENEAENLFGIWFALCDTYVENGGMFFVPGSHKNPPNTHWVRKEVDGKVRMQFEGEWPLNIPDDKFIPCEVKKGSAVLIHGGVVHRSGLNRTDKPRPIYAVHIIETDGVEWSKRNWNQPKAPFARLY